MQVATRRRPTPVNGMKNAALADWWNKLERDLTAKQVAVRTLRKNGDITLLQVGAFCDRLGLGFRMSKTEKGETRVVVAVDHGTVS